MALLGVRRRAFMRPVVTFRVPSICACLFMGRYILKGDKKIERGSPPHGQLCACRPQERGPVGARTVEAQWGPEHS